MRDSEGGSGGGGIIRICYVEHFRCDGILQVSGHEAGIIAVQRIPSFEERDQVGGLVATPDLNQDGVVSAPDLMIFQSNWHK